MKRVNGIWLPDDDTHFAEALRTAPLVDGFGTYQLNKIEAAMRRVRKFRTAIDVGGHVGLWSRILADKFEKVLAFEPMRPLAECFRKNTCDLPNVSLFEMALGNVSSSAYMERVAKNSGNSSINPDPEAKTGNRVNMVRLDSFSFSNVDFIKIDVEGFEDFVIQGGEKLIKANRPVMVVEQKKDNAERYGIGRWDATARLRSWGAREVEVISGDHIVVW